MEPQTLSDEELYERWFRPTSPSERLGAAEELERRYRRKLTANCRRILKDAHLAEDAVAQAFLKLYEKRREFTKTLRAWLWTTARNRCLFLLKEQPPAGPLPATVSGDGPVCDVGPSLAAQYLYVAEGVELPPPTLNMCKLAACVAAEGNVSAAEQTLRAARGVPLSYCADEDRLDFYEPILAARIAIAERRYEQALDFIAGAEQHAGLPPCSDIANRRPIAQARLAKLTLLKGVALLGLDEKSEEGAHFVEKALAVPKKLAESLSADRRGAFMKQFEAWKKLVEETGQSSSIRKPLGIVHK